MTAKSTARNEADSSTDDAHGTRKRHFSASDGQSVEQYMSQLLTQHKKSRHAVTEDLLDEEEEQDIRVQRAGYIKKLTLKNFMCHDHFELAFGPHMNFIIGRNGSGKSAVLTGISVGLGAKATDTNRGSSAKGLIKDGMSMARIVVELGNEGLNAFEPEVYGGSIFVERKLTREGSNSYSIKSENGSVVSHKKKTLDDILQRFSIVVNNPLSFLSQDKAREFIASSTEQSRFAYFSEGTNIRSIVSNYEESSKSIQALNSQVERATKAFSEAGKKYLESERLYKKYRQSQNLRHQSEKIHGKIYWFNVESMKNLIANKEFEVSEKTRDVDLIGSTIEQSKVKIEQEKERVENSYSEKKELEKELELKEASYTKAESERDEADSNVQGILTTLKSYKNEIKNYKHDLKSHQDNLALEQKKIDDANGGSKQDMSDKLEKLEKHQVDLEKAREVLSQQLSAFENVSPEMVALNREMNNLQATISEVKMKMSNAKNAKNDRYAAFGSAAAILAREIERESAWHQKPIGPVGCYVSVKDEFSKWGDVINATLQRTLDSFVVCDEHDRKMLNGMMRSNRAFKSIIVRKFEKFNVSNHLSSRYATMLDALQFQNEDARLTLIDSSGLEEFVVCDSVTEAENVTKDHRVKQAYALNDRNSGARISRRDGQLSRDPIFYSRELRKLAGRVDDESFAQELSELQTQLKQLDKEKRALLDEERRSKLKIQQQLDQLKSQLKSVKNSIFRTQESLSAVGDYQKIANLNSQITLCNNQIDARMGMSKELMDSLADRNSELQSKKDILQQEKQTKTIAAKNLADCESTINQQMEAIQLLKVEIDSYEKRKQSILEKIEGVKQTLLEDCQRHEEFIKLAEERCARSEVTISESDTSKSITEEYKSLQQAIEEMENQHEKSFEEVQRELLNAKTLKDKCERDLTEIDKARMDLENDLNSRFQNLDITIKQKLAIAKYSFEQSLTSRGFKGRLDFDFEKKKVIIEVQTEENKETRAVSSLSGGEKSFTQIAFLLGIWKIMKPRVCGLDEFDVFMDSVNRTIAIRLLLHELRGSTAQSIFITPQDIAAVGDLSDNEDVRIHVISPPRGE